MGNGYLKTGWFGGVRGDGSTDGFDPTTGNNMPGQASTATAAAAGAAVAFAVADLDLAGGHVDDAFLRLLDLFAALPGEERGAVRERLLELFALIGDADPRVLRARGRLASLLF